MLKRYTGFVNESLESDTLSKNINALGKTFLLYDMGMKTVVDNILSKYRVITDFNTAYQDQLRLLKESGKFPDIIQTGNKLFIKSLTGKGFVLDENDRWHPINKLNTNWSDISELLTDLIEAVGSNRLVDQLSKVTPDQLKKYLLNFKSKNNIQELIESKILDIKKYTKHNRENTDRGNKSEQKVVDVLTAKGLDIKYRGGDGDLIDIVFGIDIIGKKGGKLYLVQVKTSPWAARDSFNDAIKNPKSYYGRIDWFCAPKDAGIVIYTSKYPDGKVVVG